MFNKEGKCNICEESGKQISYTISGNVWYACKKHENEVVRISAEHHRESQFERTQSQRLRELLNTKPKNFM